MPLAKLSAQSADGTAQIRDLRRATMETQQVELIDRILSDGNIEAAIHAVKSNRGAAGIDKMTVDALEGYFAVHGEEIKEQIRAKKYKPQPVRRVYIPKANGKQRPLGIPTVLDRVMGYKIAYFMRGHKPIKDVLRAIVLPRV